MEVEKSTHQVTESSSDDIIVKHVAGPIGVRKSPVVEKIDGVGVAGKQNSELIETKTSPCRGGESLNRLKNMIRLIWEKGMLNLKAD